MNINIKGYKDKYNYVLKKAILLYQAGDNTLATIHDVKNKELQAGIPIDRKKINEILADLTNDGNNKKLQAIPENLLAIGGNSIAWFVPSRVAEIFFTTRDKKLNKTSGSKVRYPAIVFKVIDKRMEAFALRGNSKPKPNTKLFRMPFYNCSDDGWVCLPSVKLPKAQPNKIKEWEAFFYESNFSHSGAGATVKTGHNKFWLKYISECKKTMPKRFPSQYLLPTKKTLETFINE